MLFINWQPEYNVGVDELDKQHALLVQWLNNFHKAQGKAGEKDQKEILIRDLSVYITTHFEIEEEFLSLIDFPNTAEHHAKHEELSSRVNSLKSRLKKKQPIPSMEIIELLRNWIVEHVQHIDHEYSEHLNNNATCKERPFIIYSEEWSVGINSYDQFHRKLLYQFNKLAALIVFGKSKDECQQPLAEIQKLLNDFFSTEEELMETIMYPFYEEHILEHEKIMNRFGYMEMQLKSDLVEDRLEILQILSEWIERHIRQETRKYVEFVTRKNVTPESLYLTWKRSYNVTVAEMNSQHRSLFRHLNHLHDLIKKDISPQKFADAMNNFLNTLKTHYFAEETLMKRIKYPDDDKHKALHDKFVREVTATQKSIIIGRLKPSIKLLDLFRNKIIEHITKIDVLYDKFFQKDAIAVADLFATWENTLSVNHESLDKQHRELLWLLSQIYAKLTAEKSYESLNNMLEKLRRKTKAHFDNEEQIMKQLNYPELEDHIRHHRKLEKQIFSLQIWSESGRKMTAVKDLRLIKAWYLDHIKYIDSKYGEFLAQADEDVTIISIPTSG